MRIAGYTALSAPTMASQGPIHCADMLIRVSHSPFFVLLLLCLCIYIGPEIWSQTGGRVDAFTCATGTAGTLAGTAQYLKGVSAAPIAPVGLHL